MLKFMGIQNQLLLGVLQNIYCLKYCKTFVLDFPVVLKKRLRHSYFPVKLAKFFNNIFLIQYLQPTALKEYTSSIGQHLCKVNVIYYTAEAVAWMCSVNTETLVMKIFLLK